MSDHDVTNEYFNKTNVRCPVCRLVQEPPKTVFNFVATFHEVQCIFCLTKFSVRTIRRIIGKPKNVPGYINRTQYDEEIILRSPFMVKGFIHE